MSDFWGSFTDVIKGRVTDRSLFDASFYIDDIPEDSSLPYAILIEGGMDNWATFNNVTAGELVSFRILLTSGVRSGGANKLRTLSTEVNKALHYQVFETNEFSVSRCKRTAWSHPFKVEEDAMEWKQYVDFEVLLQHKEASDYFDVEEEEESE